MPNKKTSTTETARRRLLKTIAGTGGVIATGKMLPDNWKRPMVDIALLPAHAQTSPPLTCSEQCTLDISLTWSNTGVDLDLLLETPGGTTIDPKATMQTTCLQHDGDSSGAAAPASESISTIGTGVNPGTYIVYVRNPSLNSVQITYTVIGCGNNDIDISNSANPNTTTFLGNFDVPNP